ncbi:MAG TPA: AraC family transcriptional regulator [Puia sp.]|jgi:AraC-like DNA-binding protein/quercetin dioxygenase-like cupin family protein
MKAQFEPIANLESNSFNALIQHKKEFDFPFHYHPEYELTYILASEGIRYVGNHFENFGANDLVLVGPNLPHCWKNMEELPAVASALVIQWKHDFLGNEWIDSKEFDAIKKLQQLAAKGIKFPEATALQLKERLVAIVALPPFDRLITLLQILNELATTNKYDILCKEGFSHNLDFVDNQRINTVYQYVKKNYKEKITLSAISSAVNMSEVSFSRFFSKLMKKSFFAFLNEYRINIACNLLIETDWQVIQVCYASGYESLPFFYRQFKKFKKCTPQNFKSQFLKTGNFLLPVA